MQEIQIQQFIDDFLACESLANLPETLKIMILSEVKKGNAALYNLVNPIIAEAQKKEFLAGQYADQMTSKVIKNIMKARIIKSDKKTLLKINNGWY